jgi:diaminopimelate epimerase
MDMNISIMSGAGNIFAVIDNSKINLTKEYYSSICSFIISLHEFDNVSCEGILILNNSNEFDFDVWFFNPDGSSGMMCGNGGRCAFAFADFNQIIKSGKDIYFFTMAGENYGVKYSNNMISLYMPNPIQFKPDFEVESDGKKIIGSYINVGSDHFVFDFENSYLKENFDFSGSGLIDFVKKIRYRFDLFPKGTNVNYYRKIDNETFELRTYERGVEKITGACGTGAISTAWHLVSNNLAAYPVTIIPPSGLKLITAIEIIDEKKNSLILTGSVDLLKTFKIEVKDSLIPKLHLEMEVS